MQINIIGRFRKCAKDPGKLMSIYSTIRNINYIISTRNATGSLQIMLWVDSAEGGKEGCLEGALGSPGGREGWGLGEWLSCWPLAE